MVRRWLIRGVFMLPILLCAGGWVESYGHYDQVYWLGGRGCVLESKLGTVVLVYVEDGAPATSWGRDRDALEHNERRLLAHEF